MKHLRNFVTVPLLMLSAFTVQAEVTPTATAAFNSYVGSVESRLSQQHQSSANVLVLPMHTDDLLHGGLLVESVTPPNANPSGALLHHWRGTAFVPGASAAGFERLMKNFDAYPQVYAPQVLRAAVLTRQGDHLTSSMRVRQKHVIAVVMDTIYDVTFARPDTQHGFSLSRSTHVAEIDSPGTPSEHPLDESHEHGFLWRLNTYWTWEERDGGLYIQIESISLTRSVPHGLAWAVQPFVQSIPRESLEFTLRSTASALRR
jgi:hypothetical protein